MPLLRRDTCDCEDNFIIIISLSLSVCRSPSMTSSSSYLQAFHAGTAPTMGVAPLELTAGLGQLLWQQQQGNYADQVRPCSFLSSSLSAKAGFVRSLLELRE